MTDWPTVQWWELLWEHGPLRHAWGEPRPAVWPGVLLDCVLTVGAALLGGRLV